LSTLAAPLARVAATLTGLVEKSGPRFSYGLMTIAAAGSDPLAPSRELRLEATLALAADSTAGKTMGVLRAVLPPPDKEPVPLRNLGEHASRCAGNVAGDVAGNVAQNVALN
jgi:hypothetical protein